MTAGLLATIASAQFVIGALGDVGATVGFADRAVMTGQDLIGLAPLYTIFIALGFAVAFTAGGGVARKSAQSRNLIFILAGACSMAVMLLAMERVFFGVPLIAGARGGFGFAVQMLCGAAGGYVFARMRAVKLPRETLSHDEILTV